MQTTIVLACGKLFQTRELFQLAVLSLLATLFRRRSDRHIFIAYEFTLIQRNSKAVIFFLLIGDH